MTTRNQRDCPVRQKHEESPGTQKGNARGSSFEMGTPLHPQEQNPLCRVIFKSGQRHEDFLKRPAKRSADAQGQDTPEDNGSKESIK